MRMDFAEAGFEELRRAHEQLKAEHQAILATSQRDADTRLDPAARHAQLDQLREHKLRLQSHSAVLQSVRRQPEATRALLGCVGCPEGSF